MRIRIYDTHAEASRAAALVIRDVVRSKPRAVLGLATGGTPVALYRELVRLHRDEGLDFSRVTTFNLDEYLGLEPDHPQSYHTFMAEKLFSGLNLRADRTHLPSGVATDYREHCARYERLITRAGGIDVQVVGVGADGHIGFNEPGTSLRSRTNVQTLSPQTLKDNARYFGGVDDVPRHAVTMGVGTILEARRIVALASGAAKARTVALAIEGPVTSAHTGSALQLHPDTTWYLDRDAAGELTQLDMYRWIQETEARDPDGPAARLPR